MGKIKKRTHNNCFLAVDCKRGVILSSVEYEMHWADDYMHTGALSTIKLLGLDQVFKGYYSGELYDHLGSDFRVARSSTEQACDWLVRNWSKWVKEPWSRHIAIHNGGGSFWPRKVMGPRRWHKKTYSFECGKTAEEKS